MIRDAASLSAECESFTMEKTLPQVENRVNDRARDGAIEKRPHQVATARSILHVHLALGVAACF